MDPISTSSSQDKFSTDAIRSSQVSEAASNLLHEGKKMASSMYEDSKHKASEVQENLKWYTDSVASGVQKKPVASILIACGVGYILSSLWRH